MTIHSHFGTIGFVHRDCLERWIQRTGDPQCQVCHFRFAARKQSEPVWRLLSDVDARRPVLGYSSLAAVFALGHRVHLHAGLDVRGVLVVPRRGEVGLCRCRDAVCAERAVALLSVSELHKAYKKWREESTCHKLVLGTDQTAGTPWSTFRFWRTGGGSREPALAYLSAE
ncbi:hypothetical protein HPB50_022123 [Hyalomma asiaticum]|uniref:Uncharacterized protein n=1 Tax=Hyalomma asiaticum TaxID=266040 RepID=A0ACB7SJM3_HYAAI|nr:hypothetical protein HPB50_022123 [Hyalomma asiaticum]